MFFLHTIAVFLFSMISLVCVQADVYVPPVLLPNSESIWKVGTPYMVEWNITSPPTQITNPTGRIQLRKGGLTQPYALAQGFSILDGSKQIIIPVSTVPGPGYQIVLFGDSGNFSPMFTIVR
ncbi:hypothetical protein BDV98DRAFT_317852 [Pterulicium gracile]|uniref:Yeast cell wall synthesis Kre9/Knh1-like N-terminal domain-containing protein n=1 Tax=Pterulicium gracile TaxID=1884261 RepID=A0A5C3QR57_9AGAR|nr:hypothetical protein BDV98DRAFT_317852 [Pterula gracilis]